MRRLILIGLTLATPAQACRLTAAECSVVERRIADKDRYRYVAEQAFRAQGERAFEAGADAIKASYDFIARASARDSRRVQNEIGRVLQCRANIGVGTLDPSCDDAY